MPSSKFLKHSKTAFADKYRLKKLVDSSGLAEVWEATALHNQFTDVVAVKIFPPLQQAGIEPLKRRYALISHFEHVNILPAKNLAVYKNQPYLEMKFCKNGSVASKIGLLNENEIIKCFSQIASALSYFHAKSIVHKNIKPANILIDNDEFYCYHADLSFNAGLRQTVENFLNISVDEMSRLNFLSNTNKARISPACYFAPELFRSGSEASPASDIWALGATMFHIATGKLPFGFRGGEAQANGLTMNDLPSHFSKRLYQIVAKCLSEKVDDRPNAKEIIFFLKNDISANNVFQCEQVLNDNYLKSLITTNIPKKYGYNDKKQQKLTFKRLAISFLLISILGFFVFIYHKESANLPEYLIREVAIPLRIDTVTQPFESTKVIPNKSIFIKKRKPTLLYKPPMASKSILDKHFDSIRSSVEKRF